MDAVACAEGKQQAMKKYIVTAEVLTEVSAKDIWDVLTVEVESDDSYTTKIVKVVEVDGAGWQREV